MKKYLMPRYFIMIYVLLQGCSTYIDPNASVDGVIGTVGGALGNVRLVK